MFHVNPLTGKKHIHELFGKRSIHFDEVFKPFPFIGTNRGDSDQDISHIPHGFIRIIEQNTQPVHIFFGDV